MGERNTFSPISATGDGGVTSGDPSSEVSSVEFAALEWVDWFNNRRLLEPIGNIPPADAEARFYAQIEELDMVA